MPRCGGLAADPRRRAQGHPALAALPVRLGTHGIAAATAMLRIEAGRHFWSDVLDGAAVGSAVGPFVPYMHRADVAGKIFGKTGLLAELRVTPAVFSGGWGVNAMAFWWRPREDEMREPSACARDPTKGPVGRRPRSLILSAGGEPAPKRRAL